MSCSERLLGLQGHCPSCGARPTNPCRSKVVALHNGLAGIKAALAVHSFQRVDYTGDEDESNFLEGCERAHVGQAHTYAGRRGQTEVANVSFRDVADAVATELHRFRARDPDGRWDDDALAQNVCLLLEKVMGVYPNLPDLSERK